MKKKKIEKKKTHYRLQEPDIEASDSLQEETINPIDSTDAIFDENICIVCEKTYKTSFKCLMCNKFCHEVSPCSISKTDGMICQSCKCHAKKTSREHD